MPGPGKEIEVREFPLPEVEPKGALVRVEMASVCGTDVHIWRGRRVVPFPIIAGHEGVGRVYRLGAGLKTDTSGDRLLEGDRIIWSLEIACGECYFCVVKKDTSACVERKLYGYISCADPPHLNGTFSQFIYLRPRSVIFKLPDELSNEAAVPAACALSTVISGLEKVGVEVGDNILVQGAGPLGLYGLILAKEMGAAKTIVMDRAGPRLELAKSLGVDYVIDIAKTSDSNERVREVRDMTEGRGVDLVLECTGVPIVIPEGIQMLKHRGRYLLLGTASEEAGPVSINPANVTLKVLKLIGSRAYEPRHLMQALTLLRQKGKRYPFERIISHKYSLEDVPKAIEAYEKLQTVKAAIVP